MKKILILSLISILAFSSCCNNTTTNTPPVKRRIRLVEKTTLDGVHYQIVAVDSFEFLSGYHSGIVQINKK
jgi:hypothetical protein